MKTEDLLKYSNDALERSGGDLAYDGQREYFEQQSLMTSQIAGAQELLGIHSELAKLTKTQYTQIDLLAKLVSSVGMLESLIETLERQ